MGLVLSMGVIARDYTGEHTVPTAVYPLISIRIASEEFLAWIIR